MLDIADKTSPVDEESQVILDKNKRIERNLDFKALANPLRKKLLNDLVILQTSKERFHLFIMGFFFVTIVLGLVAMTLESLITSKWMFVIWGMLLSSNISVVLGHRLYIRSQENDIVARYPHEDVVIRNPVAKKVDIRTDRHGRPLHPLYNKESTFSLPVYR